MNFSGTTLFSIGQFAKLHEINKKTLMWYDEIGLLKPALVKENGYRYYTYQQSSLLETILMLRELNVSIREIQEFLEHRSAVTLENLLKEKITELDQTIAHLKSVRKIMSSKARDLAEIRTLDLSVISVIQKKERRYLVTVPGSEEGILGRDIDKVVAETKKYRLRRFHDASYGTMTPVECFYRGEFFKDSALYIELPNPIHKKGLHMQDKGNYLRAFSKGSWDNLPERYRQMLAYAKEHHLELSGYVYEKCINETVINTIDDYITQIEIPIQTLDIP